MRSRSYVEVTTIDSEHFLWRKVFSEWSRNRFPLYISPEVKRLSRLIRSVWEVVTSSGMTWAVLRAMETLPRALHCSCKEQETAKVGS